MTLHRTFLAMLVMVLSGCPGIGTKAPSIGMTELTPPDIQEPEYLGPEYSDFDADAVEPDAPSPEPGEDSSPIDLTDHVDSPDLPDVEPDSPVPDTAETLEAETVTPCPEPSCTLCRPCITDSDCNPGGGEADKCIEQDPNGRYCGIPCAGVSDCPAGYECTDAGSGALQCRPLQGTVCPCIEPFFGLLTVCWATIGEGKCETVRTCDMGCPVAGPIAEVCNGADDDCDGQTDEDLGTGFCGVGQCAHESPLCAGGKPNPCDPLAGAGQEACNGLDDDCDSLVDEDFGDTECGLGECFHKVQNCEGGLPATCDPLEGAVAEVCDGLDNDCDGETDEGIPDLTCGLGPCANTGPACVLGVPRTCTPLGNPTPEVCNGVDDDCNGQVDDMGTVSCGAGPCAKTVQVCAGGVKQECVPDNGKATGEKCDGIDNNCNGSIDEKGCPCPVGNLGGHAYEFCKPKAKWGVANKACSDHGPGYHLAIINDGGENEWIRATAQTVWANQWWWIGLYEPGGAGKWLWIDNSSPYDAGKYMNWAPGEPNDWGDDEDCGMILTPSGMWNDGDCGDFAPFICEHD